MSAMGTGRADDMVSYRNSFAFANNMALNFGLGVQGSQTSEQVIDLGEQDEYTLEHDYSARYQAALSFDFDKYSVGVAYNTGDVSYDNGPKETATALNFSAKYGTYGQGLYVAAVYGQNEFAMRPDGISGGVTQYYAFE
jgi:hypothetical protein